MSKSETALTVKELPNLNRYKKYLIAGGCLVVAVLAVFLLIQRSGYKKAEAKYQEEVKELNAEIIELKKELDKAREINVAVIESQVNSIGELASAEYKYTNASLFENSKKAFKFDIPITKKTFILKYNGVIKAGFDITDPNIKIDGDTIIVMLPPPKILSHEIDFKNAEVLNEKNGLFNSISVTDVNEFYAQSKDAMDTYAIENDLKDAALSNAKVLIENLLNANPAIRDNYKVKVTTALENTAVSSVSENK